MELTNTTEALPVVEPNTSINLISTIQVQLSPIFVLPVAFGRPIMREDFITQTGLLPDSGPQKQL